MLITLGIFLFLEQKYFKFTKRVEFDVQDWMIKWRNKSHITANEDLVLVWVSEGTIKKYDGAPPPRAIEAKLVQALHQADAKAIAFDFTFDMERNGTTDLNDVSRHTDSLIYGVTLRIVDKQHDISFPSLPLLVPFKVNELNQAPKMNYTIERIPCPGLQQYTKHIGHIMFHVSLDGAIRHVPLIIKVGDQNYPALSLIAVCILRGVPIDNNGITIKWGHYILLDNKQGWQRKIPIDMTGKMRINYIGGVDRFEQSYSFQNLERELDIGVSKDYWESLFAERLVLIGDETKEADLTHTPFTDTFPGFAVQATVIDNILNGEFVYDIPQALSIFPTIFFIGIMAILQLWSFYSESRKKQVSYQIKVIIGFIIFSCFAIFYVGFALAIFYIGGRFLAISSPLICMLLTWIIVTNYSYVEQLRQEYVYREAIIKNMGNGLVVLDGQGKITTLNQVARQLLNLGENEILGKHVKDAFEIDLPNMVYEMTKALDQKAKIAGRFSLNVGDRELEVSLSHDNAIADNSYQLIAVITDVTELHSLERSLQLQQRRVVYSQLASELNHRIKNRLQTIRLDVDKLMRKISDDESIKVIIERLLRQVVRLEKLATDFKRGISTYENVKNGYWEESSLNHVIELTLEGMYQTVDQDIKIETQLSENLPLLRLETDWLKDALQNLVNNAIDAMPQGGKLTITTEALPDKVILTISDTGDGISEEDKPKIFTPWFTKKEDGSGMGLYMVQQVIQAHNGEIGFESYKGEGTTFRLSFPIIK